MDAVRRKLQEIEDQYNEIGQKLMSEDIVKNPRELTRLSKQQAHMTGAYDAYQELKALDSRIQQADRKSTRLNSSH